MSAIPLYQIFSQNYQLAWDILDTEYKIYQNQQISIQNVTSIMAMYKQIIQKLNSLQDQRQKYFTNKLQDFILKPYVLRCISNSTPSTPTENNRKKKRMQIEEEVQRQLVKHQAELASNIIQKTAAKAQKIHSKIQQIIDEHEKKLNKRIQKRKEMRLSTKNSLAGNQTIKTESQQSQDTPKINPQKIFKNLKRKSTYDNCLAFCEQPSGFK